MWRKTVIVNSTLTYMTFFILLLHFHCARVTNLHALLVTLLPSSVGLSLHLLGSPEPNSGCRSCSSSINYFHCLGLAWSDGCLGRVNRFYCSGSFFRGFGFVTSDDLINRTQKRNPKNAP